MHEKFFAVHLLALSSISLLIASEKDRDCRNIISMPSLVVIGITCWWWQTIKFTIF